MPFKVQVGPPQIAIHQAMTVLVTEPDGHIKWPTDKGLYFFDTRLINAWAVYANGTEWELLNGGAINFDSARVFLTNKAFLTEDGPIPPGDRGFWLGTVHRPGHARGPGYHQPRPEADPLQP
ncbi:MAG: glycogen debranching N-terminal domain-containing protein [Rhodopila sp.]